jgi:polyisoprenoid-binding protein YceI
MKRVILSIFTLGAVIALSSCGESSTSSTAETTEAADVQEASAEATMLNLDTEQSGITWIGSKPTGKHHGTIQITEGNVAWNNENIEGGSFTMDITSLVVLDIPADNENNAKLTGHLMSDDFFDAANYPNAEFTITSVEPYNATQLVVQDEFATDNTPLKADEHIVENPTHWISGNLTMRGTTKNITFPAQVSWVDGQLIASAKFNINRTDWGLMYNDEASVADKLKDNFIYNTVNVGFDIVAK